MAAYKLTIGDASRLIASGELTPSELLKSLLDRIERLEPSLEAWVTLDIEGARATAEDLTSEIEKGVSRGPLHGIPVGVKDIFYTAGLKTTMGSPIYRDFIPSRDAVSVARFRDAGAVIIGKTETTEFALADPAPTRNPWNLEHTPGGSSSGSAAAVSSGMCPTALGTQTGGSVIRPASFCGIVGMKPTRDLIRRGGVYPLSWSLDHVGFFTRCVDDAAMVLGALTDGDHLDYHPIDRLEPPRLGMLRGYFQENADENVWDGFEAATMSLRDAGARVEEVSLPSTFKLIHAAHRVILASEAASVHEENFKERMTDYRVNLRGLVASGLLVPASEYLRARRLGGRFVEELEAVMRDVDCLIVPSAPTPALRGLESTGDPAFNAPWSLSGYPVMTVPSGITEDELPLGFQIIGKLHGEKHLFGVAKWCEGVFSFENAPREPSEMA
ncbi:MAG: amidase [Candidatus Bathyarchaeota archaeon]|nr:MAG: amidase [Candidatus Bathyarchaeota archaeon]